MYPFLRVMTVALAAAAALYFGTVGVIAAACAIALLTAAIEFLLTGRE